MELKRIQTAQAFENPRFQSGADAQGKMMFTIHHGFLKRLKVIKDIKRRDGNTKLLQIYSTGIGCFFQTLHDLQTLVY